VAAAAEFATLRAALAAYDIGEVLGEGACGVVIAGRHRTLGRDVAIKQLTPGAGRNAALRARFVSEARVLASLDHPHIVPVYDFVEADGTYLLVMERLTGGTVAGRSRAGHLSPQAACAVVVAAATALHHAHTKGVLHRDVKPENLMFSADGVLKVTDFGIAKLIGAQSADVTRTGQLLGTPSFMAPEQITGKEVGPSADVYALGLVLY
jgi:serine/threonine-protein kinase